jgi:hypothetical protein
MQQSCTYGSVRGALGNQRPYRDKRHSAADERRSTPIMQTQVACFESAFIRVDRQLFEGLFQQPASTTVLETVDTNGDSAAGSIVKLG